MIDIDTAEKEMTELLRKYGVKISYELAFPRYKVVPDEVKLALSMLKIHGMRLLIKLEPDTNQS